MQLLEHKFSEQFMKWKRQVEEWEANSMKPNLFEVKSTGERGIEHSLSFSSYLDRDNTSQYSLTVGEGRS